jgi:hypothetical protein
MGLGSGNPLQINLGAYWTAYPAGEAAELGGILLVIGIVFVLLGLRMKNQSLLIRTRLGGAAGILVFLTWVFSAIVVYFYFELLGAAGVLVPSPVSPITESSSFLTFIAILVTTTVGYKGKWRFAVISGFVGTVIGVMVFELPFLFLIAPRLGGSLVRSLLGESPLFCAVFASYSLLFLSPYARFSRYSLFSVAALFFAFAAWALFANFAFPSDTISFFLNSTSKVLGFVTAYTLFFPRPKRANDVEVDKI